MSSLKPIGNSVIGRIGAAVYGAVISFRNLCYDIVPPKKLPFPVISVGGISAGGTGKTPLTAFIVEYLIKEGYTPILFSRGYGRTEKENVILQADGSILSWEDVGDEPAMLRNRYPELWLAIGGNRMNSVKLLSDRLPSKAVAVMDDGFQHRKMHRDLDIVTLPQNVLTENVIPAGLLREPLSSLKRSDCIVWMGDISTQDRKELAELSNNKPVFQAETITGECVNGGTNERKMNLTRPTTLISGIARPERFHQSAQKRCKNIVDTIILPDHHIYSDADFERYFTHIDSAILTTEKDWIRLRGEKTVILSNLWYLTIEIQFTKDVQENLYQLIHNSLECYDEKSYS